MQWYYSKNDTPCGPVDDAEFRRLAQSGEITKETLVWNATMGDEWQPASSFSFLFFAPVDLQPPVIPNESESASGPQSDGTTPNRYLVSRARASLSGHWGIALGATLIYAAVFVVLGALYGLISVPAQVHANQVAYQAATLAHGPRPITVELPLQIRMIGYGIQLLQYLIAGPLTLGFCFFFLKIANRSETKASDIFKGFSLFWKAAGTYFLMMLFILLWVLLYCAIAEAFIIGGMVIFSHENFMNHRLALSWAILIPTIIVVFIKLISYSMTFFVLADNPATGPLQAIKKSTVMMSGKKWKYICLQLRFVGWWILSLLTCGIGFLWLIPYITTAKAHFYLDVKDRAALPKE